MANFKSKPFQQIIQGTPSSHPRPSSLPPTSRRSGIWSVHHREVLCWALCQVALTERGRWRQGWAANWESSEIYSGNHLTDKTSTPQAFPHHLTFEVASLKVPSLGCDPSVTKPKVADPDSDKFWTRLWPAKCNKQCNKQLWWNGQWQQIIKHCKHIQWEHQSE